MICRILLLIILTSCVSGSFVVNVTQTSYQAEENHNITLEWTFTTKPDRSTKTLNILCELITDKVSVLYQVHEGVEVSESQDAKFSGRVQSDKDALREGRIRLQLSRLRTDDSGLYQCEVNTDYGYSSDDCQLNVTAAADELKSKRPTLKSQKNNILIGVTAVGVAVVLIIACTSLYVMLKKIIIHRNLYADVEMLSVSEKQTGTDRILCAGPTLDQSESSVTQRKDSELL
ncbi:uncharacterized protein LOC116334258 [Oreochromis aureus]|uniref:uncharacterized protein LOC116334258 n=1 Tax=Oreochromis aureus TaxID=47969 RepID=UPI00195497BA|nr:uncharacterized protein LOC116334258 [Oreochromis aureus]XP_039464553.1 uncharacterized protein LOC116334258 [Oreochromis aureus]